MKTINKERKMFVFQDFENNRGNTKGKIIAFCFRVAQLSVRNKGLNLLLMPYRIWYKVTFDWLLGFEVPYDTKIGKGFKVYHHQSVVINNQSVIGDNFVARQCLTIGNAGRGADSPVIGNNVEVGANVCIIGAIRVGSNVVIGAGSVVVKDVPDNSIVVGNPARVVRIK